MARAYLCPHRLYNRVLALLHVLVYAHTISSHCRLHSPASSRAKHWRQCMRVLMFFCILRRPRGEPRAADISCVICPIAHCRGLCALPAHTSRCLSDGVGHASRRRLQAFLWSRQTLLAFPMSLLTDALVSSLHLVSCFSGASLSLPSNGV